MSRARELYNEFQPLSCVENRKSYLQRTLPWCLRLVLAGVFFYAGWVKVKDPTLAFRILLKMSERIQRLNEQVANAVS